MWRPELRAAMRAGLVDRLVDAPATHPDLSWPTILCTPNKPPAPALIPAHAAQPVRPQSRRGRQRAAAKFRAQQRKEK